jgi:predicted lipoprotein with Yx(FWY)xxD motif
MKNRIKIFTYSSLVLAGLFLAGCKGDDDVAPTATGIQIGDNSILTDDQNHTLYFFSTDVNGQSTCLAGCDTSWPAAYIDNPTFGSNVNAADFGTITRTDGKEQTTYKGWPLYYYSPTNDGQLEAAGQKGGEGIDNLWFAAKTDYSVMVAKGQLVGHDGKNYTSDGVEGDGASEFLVDANGRTLYWFTNDTKNNNNFTAADLSNNNVWIMYEGTGEIPSILSQSDFGSITVSGHNQVTYRGRPLYQFGGLGGATPIAGDAKRGDTRGVSVPTPGAAIWRVANRTTSAAPNSVTITGNATLGGIITDSKGRTLYMFTQDTDLTSHCTSAACANKWPAFYTDVVTVTEAGSLAAGDFSEITRTDGKKQTTYKGWPLYYFSTDGTGVIETAGLTGGNGFANGLWYAARTYSLMVADAQLVKTDGLHYTTDYSQLTQADGNTLYFIDGNGRTVYRHILDTNGHNSFYTGDAGHDGNWPPYYVAIDALTLPSTVNKADFAVITTFGKQQLTYKGWPLYYFLADISAPAVPADRTNTKGINVGAYAWPVVYFGTTVAPQ